jgi:3-oxoacyl-(acyl-carrier-protein) synthase
MQPLKRQVNSVLKNGFAFGGINAALVCRKI